MPYTCIQPDCQRPHIYFSSSKEWGDHIREEHKSVPSWLCSICPATQTFNTAVDFEYHLTNSHKDVVAEESIAMVVETCKDLLPAEILGCPLCKHNDPNPSRMLDHIANHVHNFSMRSLPWPPNVTLTEPRVERERVYEWLTTLDNAEIPVQGASPAKYDDVKSESRMSGAAGDLVNQVQKCLRQCDLMTPAEVPDPELLDQAESVYFRANAYFSDDDQASIGYESEISAQSLCSSTPVEINANEYNVSVDGPVESSSPDCTLEPKSDDLAIKSSIVKRPPLNATEDELDTLELSFTQEGVPDADSETQDKLRQCMKEETDTYVSLPEYRVRKPHLYHVGIICALDFEKAAVEATLDEVHERPAKATGDGNAYTLGKIGAHNVIVACLPAGVMGKVSASVLAKDMMRSFPIKTGLMVGICGGVWSERADIRLGDVVVSQPDGMHGGVVQWDYSKMEREGVFRRTGTLNKPPRPLLNAVQSLRARHWRKGNELHQSLQEMLSSNPYMAEEYERPGAQHD
jgi:hypothetical protein